MRKGFTLAEVLITLGVIGVVAAMTLPVLIANYKDKVYEAQSKKAQTVLANGIKMLMAKEDVTDVKDIALANCTTRDCMAEELSKVFNIVQDIKEDGSNAPEKYSFLNGDFPIWSDKNLAYGFVTNDGIMIGVKKFAQGASGFTFVADLNGNKNPNKGGKDLCKYVVSNTGTLRDYCSSMTSCGGTAYNPSKYFSWGMPEAMAVAPPVSGPPTSADSSTVEACINAGGEWHAETCPAGSLMIDGTGFHNRCCVPELKPSNSCF